MIPILIGPTGLGYTDIEIINNSYIEKTTRQQNIVIGQLSCITGYTGRIGNTGPSSIITGPTGGNITTGSTGINMDAILFEPNNCKMRVLYSDNTYKDFGPFICNQTPQIITGNTGPSGANVDYIVQYSNSKIQTIYSNNYVTYSNIACLCQPQTGYTGPTGTIVTYGSTGPTGINGINSTYGTTGPTGSKNSSPAITNVVVIDNPNDTKTININNGQYISSELIDIPGYPGEYIYSNLAYGILDPNGLQFNQTGNMALKRSYIGYKNWSQIIFPNSPLTFNVSYNSNNINLDGLGDGLLCKSKMILRIRMSWDCDETPFIRPFVALNLTNSIMQNIFPTLITTSFPNMTLQDDMYCLVQDGDIISIVAGAYSMYPISNSKVFKYNFKNINMTIVQMFTY